MITLFERLKNHVPFSFLDAKHMAFIQEHAVIAYYPEQTELIQKDREIETCYVVIKGVVEAKEEDTLIDIYHEDDLFGGIAVVKDQRAQYSYVVSEELICYEIPKAIFLKVCEESVAFKNYFYASIVERMEILQERQESAKMAEMMITRVDHTLLHPLCVVDHQEDIITALRKMEGQKAVALLVQNENGYGIVTDSDLRHYIIATQEERAQTISQIQSMPLITIKEGELLFNSLLLMTNHAIKHLPVLGENGIPIGILTLTDLLSHFANQSHIIQVQIERATSVQAVIDASRRMDSMVKTLHIKGVKSRYIARLVSEIHKKMYQQLFVLIFPHHWQDQCTLILLGSEGRGEQILKTDQDNALILRDGFRPENLEEITTHFIETLKAIGFPPCQGGVMMTNPKWCKAYSAYQRNIHRWISEPSGGDLVDMAIFYDSYAVAGERQLYTELRDMLLLKVKEQQSFLPHFAKAIESFESPLGLFSRFITDKRSHQDALDIKKGALFALIHGVRALALEHGISKTNTTERIKALHDVGYMSKRDASDLIETLEVINTLRLHAQLNHDLQGKALDNYIVIHDLGKLERDTLKEALKSVESFKKRVSYHFHLSVVM